MVSMCVCAPVKPGAQSRLSACLLGKGYSLSGLRSFVLYLDSSLGFSLSSVDTFRSFSGNTQYRYKGTLVICNF